MKKIITLMILLVGMVTTASAYYSLPGGWNGWNVAATQFNNNTVTILLEGNHTYEFKFYNSEGNNGSGSYNGAGSNWENVTMTSSNCTDWGLNSNDQNVKITTTITGEYNFTLGWDDTTPKISVTYPTTSTYTRSVTSGNFGTICLPYAATVTGATVFKIVSKYESGGNLAGINLESVDNLEAGKAYIFKADGSTLTATLSGNSVGTATPAYGMTGNLSSTPANVTDGYYVLSQNKLRKVNGGTATVAQYRAYITLDGISTASARNTNYISLVDESTGIDEMGSVGNVANETFYNLAGQRVNQPTKGLYIVNGKKMLRK